jgi:glycosyltransferase involved in cell wall biosynthesis
MLAPHPQIRSPLNKHTPALAAALRDLGCSVRCEGWGRRQEGESPAAKLAGRTADIAQIRRILRAERFDMLLVKTAHDWATLSRDIALLLSTRGLCRRRILQLHGSHADRLAAPAHRAFKLASALLARLPDALLVLSQEECRDWQSFYPRGRVYVVKNPLPPALSPNSSQATTSASNGDPASPKLRRAHPTVLFVGRLMDAKGVRELIEAWPAVLAQRACHLVLAGDGPAAQALRDRVAALGLGASITLAGYLEGGALETAYRSADLFVLPSWTEGFSFAILEAMAAGLPIVTTRLRGMVDHLREGEHALFVPPRDPAALAAALIRLLSNAELRTRMGQANRVKVRDFAPATVGREFLGVLEEIADTPRSAR